MPSTGVKCQVGDFVLLVDPPTPLRAGDLILKTKTDWPLDTSSPPEVIQGPGEYEIKGVRIKGFELTNDDAGHLKTSYLVDLEGIRLSFLDELLVEPSKEVLGELGEVDILFISADFGKSKTRQLTSLVKQVDPKIIVPTDDKTAKALAEELGQRPAAEEKLVIKKKDLTSEVTNKLIWLKRAKVK